MQHLLAPILHLLFRMHWSWPYVLWPWRIAQVVLMYTKDSPSDHVLIVPISLITVFRKTVERCIQSTVQTEGSPLDSA